MTKRFLTLFSVLLAAAAGALIWLSCSIEQPSVGKDDEDTKVNHAKLTEDAVCTQCHEENRPAPTHGKGVECGVCHETSDTKGGFVPKEGITSSGEETPDTDTTSSTDTNTEQGDPSKVHEHPAGLTSCVACHEKDRAPPPHPETGDCAACHEPSNTGGGWKPK